MPVAPGNEVIWRLQLDFYRTGVTNAHIRSWTYNDQLQPYLRDLSDNTALFKRRMGRFVRDEPVSPDSAPDPHIVARNQALQRIIHTCELISSKALSIATARWLHRTLTAVQFEVFTPPHGISTWDDWTSHRRDAAEADLAHLHHAIRWWKQLYEQGNFMAANAEKILVDLRGQNGILSQLNHEYEFHMSRCQNNFELVPLEVIKDWGDIVSLIKLVPAAAPEA